MTDKGVTKESARKKKETLAERIYNIIKKHGEPMGIQEIASEIPDKPVSTIRGRLRDKVNILFKKVARGVYWVNGEDSGVLLVEGDGRDLSMFEDGSIDCIITDHPWDDPKSNIGGDRKFTHTYNTFRYSKNDFNEKARVLKDGGFLVEFIPAENENNYEYLYQIKQYAKECGLLYYSKVPWKKGRFVSNTGRKSKNTEDILFFSKGKARNMRLDVKKTKASGVPHYMSGTKRMLPTMFVFQPPSRNEKIHQSQKPLALLESILDYVTEPGEIVLDQAAGSGVTGKACLKKGRFCILFEILEENIKKIKENLQPAQLELSYI